MTLGTGLTAAEGDDLTLELVADLLEGQNLYGAFGVKGFSMATPKFCDGLIASVTARWHDCGERVEVEINYSLEGFCGCAVSELVRQGVEPSGIFGLQCD